MFFNSFSIEETGLCVIQNRPWTVFICQWVKAHQNNEQLRAEQIKFVNMNENWGNDKWLQNYWLHNNWPIDSWLNHNWASDNWVNEQMVLEQMTTKSLLMLIKLMQVETFKT